MKFRWLVVIPIAGALLFLVLDTLLAGSGTHATFRRVEMELVKSASLAGSLAAAFAFGRGEYLRTAWLFVSGCMFLLLTRDLIGAIPGVEWNQGGTRWLLGAFSVLANLSQVIGTWMLARAWHRAGMGFPGPFVAKAAVFSAAILLAGAFGGPPLVTHAGRIASGDGAAVTMFASGVGDIVSLCLIAPLLLTAVALRGGLLGWPWALLTVSYLMWLGYDASHVLGPALGAEAATVSTVNETFRTLGCLFGMSAGLAQRFVVRRMERA